MNAADVIAYTYDADYHCAGCAIARFGEHPNSPAGAYPWCRDDVPDAEGNIPYPVFGDSEWWDVSPDATYPQSLVCATCGGTIDTLGKDGYRA